ncbi:MAG: MFS transporter [Candidatus Promineofilum sp.]|nr:MFS transporter [Promineifilum sp.]
MPITRLKSVYFIYYGALACLAPFMSLIYLERGMNGTEIGILSGMVPLVTWISTPVWSGIADAHRRHHAVLLLGIAGLWAVGVAFYFANAFSALLAVVILYAIFNAPIIPLIDHMTISLPGDDKARYGRVRLWGSVGWGLAAALLGPVLQRSGLGWAFYSFLVLMAVNFVVSFRLPMNITVGDRQDFSHELKRLLRRGRFLLLLLVSLVYGITLGILNSYQFLYLEELGASRTVMALSLTMMTVSEIPIWLLGGFLLRRFGASRMIAMALAVGTVRNLAMGAIVAPWLVLPISLLQGPSFAVLWSAGVADADAVAPPGLGATAQGLFAGMVLGLGSALGGFLGGPASEFIGYAGLFSAMGWLCLAMLAVFVAARMVPRRRRSPAAV